MKVVLPDGSEVAVSDGSTAAAVAESIGSRLAKAAIGAKVGDRLVDLNTGLHEGDHVAIITPASPEGLDMMRHSAAHVLAEAATRLFVRAKTVGKRR